MELEKAAILAIKISAEQTEEAAAEGWSCVLKAMRQLNDAKSQAEIAKAEALEATRQLTHQREDLPQPSKKAVSPEGPGEQASISNAQSIREIDTEASTTTR